MVSVEDLTTPFKRLFCDETPPSVAVLNQHSEVQDFDCEEEVEVYLGNEFDVSVQLIHY